MRPAPGLFCILPGFSTPVTVWSPCGCTNGCIRRRGRRPPRTFAPPQCSGYTDSVLHPSEEPLGSGVVGAAPLRVRGPGRPVPVHPVQLSRPPAIGVRGRRETVDARRSAAWRRPGPAWCWPVSRSATSRPCAPRLCCRGSRPSGKGRLCRP